MVVSNIFCFHPYFGKIPNLTNIFQMGWNHHLVLIPVPERFQYSQCSSPSTWKKNKKSKQLEFFLNVLDPYPVHSISMVYLPPFDSFFVVNVGEYTILIGCLGCIILQKWPTKKPNKCQKMRHGGSAWDVLPVRDVTGLFHPYIGPTPEGCKSFK